MLRLIAVGYAVYALQYMPWLLEAFALHRDYVVAAAVGVLLGPWVSRQFE